MPVRKIRAVIDTNVLVSGVISPKGAPRKILDLARKEVFKAVSSVSINHEILDVLHRDYIYSKYNVTEEIIDDISVFLLC
ncbi:MAG TPA: putative toxin-antitoxin system toxin component, PIN family [Nitrospiraceae bacterium]|nr:putative toxin-antitoxin system toxin component, PIN family [Nitrospiraceae bacterium]